MLYEAVRFFFYQWLLISIALGHKGEEVDGGRKITILILASVEECVRLRYCQVASTVFCGFLALLSLHFVCVCVLVLKYCLLPRKLPPQHTHTHHPGGPDEVGNVLFLGVLGDLGNNQHRNSLSSRYLRDIHPSGATWYCLQVEMRDVWFSVPLMCPYNIIYTGDK